MAQIIIKNGEISSSAGINIPGNLSISGNVTLGENFTDTLTVNSAATFNDDIIVNDTVSASAGNFTTINVGTISATNFVGLPPSVGGATSPGGADTAIQFNKQGTFSGSNNLNYSYDTNTLSGTTAQFTTLTASSLYISSSGNSIIDVSSNSAALRVTQRGNGESIRVEDSTNPDSTPFVINSLGNVGIGTSSPVSKLYVKGDTIISGSLTLEGASYLIGPISESAIYNFKYIKGNNSLYLGGNSEDSGTVYINNAGGWISCFTNQTGTLYVNGDTIIGNSSAGGYSPVSKLEITGTKPYLTLATTTTPETPSAGKTAFWADSTYKEPYFKNENGDSINLSDGGGETLMRMQGFATANLTSTKTLTSNTTYALYLGKCPHYLLSGDSLIAKYRVTTQAATITWAEVAVATGFFISSGPSALTTRGFANIAAVVNSTGVKSTNITLTSNIVPGTDMWLLFGVQATTPGVYRAASIADDIQTGVQLAATSTRPSTMVAGAIFSVESATILPMWITLKV